MNGLNTNINYFGTFKEYLFSFKEKQEILQTDKVIESKMHMVILCKLVSIINYNKTHALIVFLNSEPYWQKIGTKKKDILITKKSRDHKKREKTIQ